MQLPMHWFAFMDALGITLFVILGVAISGAYLLHRVGMYGAYRRLAQQLATRSGGKLHGGGWLERPTVEFQHRGARVRIRSTTRHQIR